MNEVEKMYKLANVKAKEYCDRDSDACMNCCPEWKNRQNCWKYKSVMPPFTAEKQLELIKWLSKNKNGFNVFYDTGFNSKEKHYWCCADQSYEDFNYCCHEKEFSEALAGLINDLPLTDAERKQIKEILSE